MHPHRRDDLYVRSAGPSDERSQAEGSSADNSALRTVTYPASTSNNKAAGIQYLASTVGFTGVHLQWDQNNSATASKYWRLQYTTDGTTWIDKDVITAPGNANWVDGLAADFSSIPATANNPNFGFRLVSEFQSTATGSGTAGYVGNSSTYIPAAPCGWTMSSSAEPSQLAWRRHSHS